VFWDEPFTTAQLWEKLNERAPGQGTEISTITERAGQLRAALPGELRRLIDREGPFKQKVGLAFAERRGRRFGNSQVRVDRGEQDAHGKVATWMVTAEHER
jgi:hypothetical protein